MKNILEKQKLFIKPQNFHSNKELFVGNNSFEYLKNVAKDSSNQTLIL